MVFQNNILAGAAGAAGDTALSVSKSVRFNDDDSAFMYRTPYVEGNRKTWTVSYWMKRCNLGAVMYHWAVQEDGQTGSQRLYCIFRSDDKLEIGNASATILQSNAVFRDPSAWGHFVITCDTTLATAADRIKVYYNGVRLTSWATDAISTQVAQNSDQAWNSTELHNIGDDPNVNNRLDGYMSQFYHIDGMALEPTSFGETDDNGVWRPIEYAGTDGSAVTITFVEQAKTDSSSTTYTFSGATLGGSAGDHLIIGTTGRQTTAGTNDITSVTVDGNTAVELVDSPGSNGTQHTGLWIAEGKGNSTGDIVVVFASACNAAAYAVWRATNVGTVGAYDSASEEASGGTDPSETITIPAGGALIAYADTNGSSKSFSWTNATERFDADAGDADNWHSGASDAFAAHTTDRAITVDQGTTTSRAVFCSINKTVAYGVNGFFLDFSDSANLGKCAARGTGLVAASSGTAIGDLTLHGGNAAAFNGKRTETDAGAANTGDDRYIGKTWDSAISITGFKLWSYTDKGFKEGSTSDVTVVLYGKNGAAPSNSSDGTALQTITVSPDSNTSAPPATAESFGGFTSASYLHNWCKISIGTNCHVGELEFYTGTNTSEGSDWVSSGLAANDQVNDTPTDNHATFNPLDRNNGQEPTLGSVVALSNGNLNMSWSSTNQGSSRSTLGMTTGKYYAEATYNDSTTSSFSAGVVGIKYPLQHFPIDSPGGRAHYDASGVIHLDNNNSVNTGLATFTTNDVIGMQVDCDASPKTIEFFKNGTSIIEKDLDTSVDTWFFSIFVGSATRDGDMNFGQYDFARTPDAGFKALSTANLPAPTIEDGTAHFQTTLYTGDAKVRNIDQTGNSTFQPDIVWIKNRDTTDTHMLMDASRGPAQELNPEDVRVESLETQGLIAFSDKSWIDASSLTKIGDMTLESGLSHGFDGDSYKGFAECAAGTGTGYCGVDWGSGNTKTITQMVTFGSNDYGYSNPGRTITLAIEGSNDNTTFTDLGGGLTGLTDTTTDEHAKIITPTSTTGYRYHRAKVTSSVGSVHFAEVAFFEDTTTTREGFTLASGPAGYNDNTEKFVAWQWKAGGGAGTSNTAGTLNTTKTSVNTTAGISVSTYTGGGSATTIGHGLGVAPRFIIQKERTNDVGSWHVYHAGLASDAETDYITLDATSAKADLAGIWNDTAPTSTVLSLGSNDDLVGSSDTNVIYAFAEVEGFSKFDFYEGFGNAFGPFIYLGFKPAWLMIKNIDSGSTNWNVFDIARQPQNLANGIGLRPNATQAEHTSSIAVDLLSNGFKLRDTGSDINSAVTFIYAAFAAHPIGGSGVTPATAI